jgi:3-hydroxyisobutyrate dehydrogenase-like beta-hydroxyacid dehydrogenase
VPVPPGGQIVVETSTLTLEDKQRAAAALRAQGRQMLDVPISGTASGIPAQTWIAYLSGPVAACRQAAPVLRCFTLKAPRVGALGSGTKLKYAANHLVAIHNVACAEMTLLCRKMDLDPAIALELLGSSPYLGTGLMRIRMPMMLSREYEPATMKVRLWQKDMQVIGETARNLHCPTPLLDACASLYTAAMAQGHGEHDTASVAEVLRGMSGETKRPNLGRKTR